MAGKKAEKKALTPEEKLTQALVPAEEQPYPVPGNWCWTRIGNLCSFIGGGTPDKAVDPFWNGSIPWASVKDIKGKYLYSTIDHITELGVNSSSTNLCVPEDLLLVTRIEPAKAIIAKIQTAINQDLKIVKSSLPTGFLYYYFLCFKEIFESKASGSTVKGITIPSIQNTAIPLPPLAEQHRIVDRIEGLFAKLDEVKEKAQAVVDSFKTRKAAILHKAFTGELTEQWRQTHKLRLEDWKEITIDSIASLITKGASPKWQGINYTSDTSQTLFVTSENVREGFLSFEKEKYLDNKINEIQSRSILHYGDVLVNIVGASIGRAAVFNRNQLANVNQAVCIIRLKEDINNQFICLYLNSPFAQMYYSDNKVETARANISLSDIKAMPIKMPTIDEQLAILQILQGLFAKEQQAKVAAEAVLDQIDSMKKSILARAFRGELGTNDPAEEGAVELLKTIL